MEELFTGLNKIGITTSLDQAKALLLNAKSDSSPFLTIEEFGQLVFTADEAINVDLQKHQKTSKLQELDLTAKLLTSQQLNKIDMQALSPQLVDKIRLRNKWRACI